MNVWDAFAAAPVWFVVWTLAAGLGTATALRGLAALVVAFRARAAP
ncbi:MAG: hypothetical protein IPO09_19040 [Anaeromyxobacter sp.]|nr:hypothetical protein [Anaeromyxobacter sp.]MBL0276006.1 hypothetical protein [Anaeromyxobacter sp.]